MPANDLCLLQDVKAWIYGNPSDHDWPTASDALLSSYISAASRTALLKMQRSTLIAHKITEYRSGVNGQSLVLREWPVLGDLASLIIDGRIIAKAAPLGQPSRAFGGGWLIENPWTPDQLPGRNGVLMLRNGIFCRGQANIQVQYNAGYAILLEAGTIPVTGPYTIDPQAPYGRFSADFAMTYTNGQPLAPVATSGALAQGLYLPPTPPKNPKDLSYVPAYTFSSSDAGQSVLLSYSFTPDDLSQAIIKWVGEWWKYKDRIGERSRALPQGGGTASFDIKAMPDDVALTIGAYSRSPVLAV
jgi:hypothetical protein